MLKKNLIAASLLAGAILTAGNVAFAQDPSDDVSLFRKDVRSIKKQIIAANLELSDSEVRKVLKNSSNSEQRETVWTSSKGVGLVVAEDLRELVKLRNQAAVKRAHVHHVKVGLHDRRAEVGQGLDRLGRALGRDAPGADLAVGLQARQRLTEPLLGKARRTSK